MDEHLLSDPLTAVSHHAERPFTSNLPFIAWLRQTWLLIAERAFIRPLHQQQNRFNQQLLKTFAAHDEWLIAQDRTLNESRPPFGDLVRQTRRLQREIEGINGRLQTLEQTNK